MIRAYNKDGIEIPYAVEHDDNELQVIKPCPFCGSKKIRVWEKSDNYWDIQCDDEDAVCAAMLYDHESKEMAIDHWNKRAL